MNTIRQLRRRFSRWALARDVSYLALKATATTRVHRADIRGTVHSYTSPALEMVCLGLCSADEAEQSVFAEAMARGLPEGYLWVWTGLADRPAGDWQHTAEFWGQSVQSLKGALLDPVTAARLKEMKGPDADLTRRLGAVFAVIAEADWRASDARPVRRLESPYVTYEPIIDRTEGCILPVHWEQYRSTQRLANPELTTLIWQRPEEAARIAEIMHERSTDDATLIASILDSESPALSGGIL